MAQVENLLTYGAKNKNNIVHSSRILYQSIVNVGGLWYGFGWESQLLETGFLAIWMTPWFSLSQFPKNSPTPLVVRHSALSLSAYRLASLD